MPPSEDLMPEGERMRKAVRWISEICCEHEERNRESVIREAELRFDLTPRECEFLNSHFCEAIAKG